MEKNDEYKKLLQPCADCGSYDIEWCGISIRPYCRECGKWGRLNFGDAVDAIDDWNKSYNRTGVISTQKENCYKNRNDYLESPSDGYGMSGKVCKSLDLYINGKCIRSFGSNSQAEEFINRWFASDKSKDTDEIEVKTFYRKYYEV